MKPEKVEWFLLVAQFCFLPALAFLLRNAWFQRAHAETVAGELVLRVPLQQVMRWETALVFFAWLGLFWQGVKCASLVAFSRPIPLLELASALTWSLFMVMVIGFHWASRGTAYLEFRERGIVCGPTFWPWESIRTYSWTDQGLGLRIKRRNAAFSFQLRPGDGGTVQSVLEKHVTDPSVANSSA